EAAHLAIFVGVDPGRRGAVRIGDAADQVGIAIEPDLDRAGARRRDLEDVIAASALARLAQSADRGGETVGEEEAVDAEIGGEDRLREGGTVARDGGLAGTGRLPGLFAVEAHRVGL